MTTFDGRRFTAATRHAEAVAVVGKMLPEGDQATPMREREEAS